MISFGGRISLFTALPTGTEASGVGVRALAMAGALLVVVITGDAGAVLVASGLELAFVQPFNSERAVAAAKRNCVFIMLHCSRIVPAIAGVCKWFDNAGAGDIHYIKP